MKTTLVIGASENPSRYSHEAIKRLRDHGHDVVALGKKEGSVRDVKIQIGKPLLPAIDTVTLYINEQHQQELQDYILDLKPKRIIFNPGAENPALEKMAKEKGIETIEACTLTMLSIGAY